MAATPARPVPLSARILWPDGRDERALLEPTDLSGGAGEIFLVTGRPDLVAKIYHAGSAPAHLERYRHKIGWMSCHHPVLPGVAAGLPGIVQLAWPEAAVLREGRFAGFVMQKVDFERTLELDYLLNRRQAAQENFEVDYGRLATVACNLAAVIACLHDMRIAVVDLKPMNIKVYRQELFVSILDCDGFHIESAEFQAEAPQVTPEYLAPEFHGTAVTNPEAQDRFALALIIFRLFNFGIHPYAGVAARGHGAPAELVSRIRQRLYPYARVPPRNTRPVPASVHSTFADPLREMFDRAFAGGAAMRPSAH
jgi:DNA-binding helix-hairpin-helix protein with protein kinase domain